jgi:hypothetical protein
VREPYQIRDRRWDLSEGCANATASSSREFCQGVDHLKAQLDVAATAAVLREKIDKLNKSIETLRSQGAAQLADPQSFGLAKLIGTGQDSVRIGLSVLLALVIESVCCLACLFSWAPLRQRAMRKSRCLSRSGGGSATVPSPIRRDGRACRHLRQIFAKWGANRGAPRLGAQELRQLLQAACGEVGLSYDRQAVVGLKLGRVNPPLHTA